MKYGLVGEKLGHSFSPEIHKKIGLYDYELCEVAKTDIDSFFREKDFAGINITIPYKQTVIPYLSYIDESAKEIGAVNVAVNRDGALYGYNTDFIGLSELIERAGFDMRGACVLVFGTGGTNKTARAVAKSLGASQIITVSREEKEGAVSYARAYLEYADADFIINTTPAGMYPSVDALPYDIDLTLFKKLRGVVDVIFNPLRTNLVNRAELLGIPAVGGLYMLVSQAVAAAELFTGKALNKKAICERIYAELRMSKENIVLTGMPGGGKSTVGRILAERLSRPFYDTDEEFEKRFGSTAEYIRAHGESDFRDKESEVIASLAGNITGAVISTGGGAVLREENVLALRRNGKVYFIDRDISLITPTSSRPLSSDREMLEKRYRERYGIYTATSDKRIENNGEPADAAEKIEKEFKK